MKSFTKKEKSFLQCSEVKVTLTKCSPIVSRAVSILKSSRLIPILQRLLSISRTSCAKTGRLATFLLISDTSLRKVILMSFSFDKNISSERMSCFVFSSPAFGVNDATAGSEQKSATLLGTSQLNAKPGLTKQISPAKPSPGWSLMSKILRTAFVNVRCQQSFKACINLLIMIQRVWSQNSTASIESPRIARQQSMQSYHSILPSNVVQEQPEQEVQRLRLISGKRLAKTQLNSGRQSPQEVDQIKRLVKLSGLAAQQLKTRKGRNQQASLTGLKTSRVHTASQVLSFQRDSTALTSMNNSEQRTKQLLVKKTRPQSVSQKLQPMPKQQVKATVTVKEVQLQNGQLITPEMAAHVVRDFILPMFDVGKKVESGGAVYKELILSKMLAEQVQQMRCLSNEQQETIQQLQCQIKQHQNEVSSYKQIIAKFKLKVKQTVFQNSKNKKQKDKYMFVNQCLEKRCETLTESFQSVEKHLKRNGAELSTCKVALDNSINSQINIKHIMELMKIENDVMRDRLGQLFESLITLGDVKVMQDQFQTQIEQTKQIESDLKQQISLVEQENQKLQAKASEFWIIINELQQAKDKLRLTNELKMKLVKKKLDELEFDRDKYNQLKKDAMEGLTKAQKTINLQQTEIERCNLKIQKLRQRRNVDLNQKVCQNCNKEYKHNENFNWSCCTHRSEWGGTMWWCCGKPKITSKGCKFQKHVSKDDIEEDEDGTLLHTQQTVRCIMCKAAGHLASECDKDPNIRSSYDIDEENLRVNKMLVSKKVRLADGSTVTQNFFERTAIVSNERLTSMVMQQDDFNYKQFNDRIFNLDIPMGIEYTDNTDNDDDQEDQFDNTQGDLDELQEFKPKPKPDHKVNELQKLKIFTNDQKQQFLRAQNSDPFHDLLTEQTMIDHNKNINFVDITDAIQKLQEAQNRKARPRVIKKKRRMTKTNANDDVISCSSKASIYTTNHRLSLRDSNGPESTQPTQKALLNKQNSQTPKFRRKTSFDDELMLSNTKFDEQLFDKYEGPKLNLFLPNNVQAKLMNLSKEALDQFDDNFGKQQDLIQPKQLEGSAPSPRKSVSQNHLIQSHFRPEITSERID